MTPTGRLRTALFAVFSLATITAWYFMLRSNLAAQRPGVALFGAAFDLMVTIPVLYYFLVVRRTGAKPATIAGVLVFCATAAAHIVPTGNYPLTKFLPLIAAPLELAVIAMIFARVRAALRQSLHGDTADPIEAFRNAASAVIGDNFVAAVLVSEIATFYYGLFSWRRKATETESTLTFYKDSGWGTIVGGLVLAIVAESTAVHLWLSGHSPLAAWVMTGLDFYGIVWLLGDLQGFRLRPSHLGEASLHLEFGLRWRGDLGSSDIETVARAAATTPKKSLKLALAGEPQMLIQLRGESTFQGMYGLRRTRKSILIRVDQPERLEQWARNRGLWSEPPEPAAVHEQPSAQDSGKQVNREEWMRRRPPYIPVEDWIRSLPPE